MKDTIIPDVLQELVIDITNPHYGGQRFRETTLKTQWGIIVDTDSFWLMTTVKHTITSLEKDFQAACEITFAFRFTPIKTIKADEFKSDIYECFIFTKTHLEDILNCVYSKQLPDNLKYVIDIGDVFSLQFGEEEMLAAIRQHFLS